MSGESGVGRRAVMVDPRRVRVPMPTQAPTEEFRASVSAYGIIAPILIRETAGGDYDLLGGHKRLEAALAAGAESVPATVLEGALHAQLAVAFNEDYLRKPVHSTVECAHAVMRLQEARRAAGLPITRQAMAQALHVSPASIQRWVNFGTLYPVERMWGLAHALGVPESRLREISAREARSLQDAGEDDGRAIQMLRGMLFPPFKDHANEIPSWWDLASGRVPRWWKAAVAWVVRQVLRLRSATRRDAGSQAVG